MALLLGVVLFARGAFAGVPPQLPQGTAGGATSSSGSGPSTAGGGSAQGGGGQVTPANDGFDQLPPSMMGLSYSTLAHIGRVHPQAGPGQTRQDTSWHNPFSPLLNITWGPERNTSSPNAAGEPAVGINQINPLYAMVSGNFSLDHTTDAGNT